MRPQIKAGGVSEKVDSCIKCGRPIQQAETGRPAIYCGPACRQAAAYELKRIQRRLEALEERRSDLRHSRSTIRDWLGRTPKVALVDVEAEIATDEARLRLLLSEPRGKSPERGFDDERMAS